MSEAEGGQKPEPGPAPDPRPKKRRKWVGVLVAVLAIVVLIAVAMSFNLPAQTPEGDQSGPTWQHVATLSGPLSPAEPFARTDAFDVTGSKFRMTWSVTEAECTIVGVPGACDARFFFDLFEEGTTSGIVISVFIGPGYTQRPLAADTVLSRSGSFYLVPTDEVNLSSWTVTVDEWK